MIDDRFERPVFTVVRDDGYDRAHVDAYLEDRVSSEIEAEDRIQDIEATMSELEDLAEASRRDRHGVNELIRQAQANRDEAERRAAKIVEAAHLRAAELYKASLLASQEAQRLVKEAQAERYAAEWRAAEILTGAQAEAEAMVEKFRPSAAEAVDVRQEIGHLVEEARRQVHCFAEEVEATAERGAAVVMTHSQPHLDEIRRGLDLLDAQRQAVLGDLFRLRETLDGFAVDI